jgi:Zn-dependent protease
VGRLPLNNDKVEKNNDRKSSIFQYSIFIGRIGGVPINIHFSFALIFSLIVWTLSYTFFPFYHPGLSQLNYIILGLTGGFIALFSILVHELGHSTMAKKYGIKFERIVLFAFGGVSLSDNEITDPKKEINMAFAGPYISFIISSISFSLWLILIRSHLFPLEGSPLGSVLLYSGLINLGLVLFNLLPVFPSDGGRILRALLSKYSHKDHAEVTKGAIRIGVVVSLGLILVGIIIGLNYSFLSGLWLMILAFFLIKQSKWYYRQYQNLSSQI